MCGCVFPLRHTCGFSGRAEAMLENWTGIGKDGSCNRRRLRFDTGVLCRGAAARSYNMTITTSLHCFYPFVPLSRITC